MHVTHNDGILYFPHVQKNEAMPHSPATESWIASARAQAWSEATIRKRLDLLARLERLHDHPAHTLSRDELRAFLASLDVRPATRRQYWLWLDSFYAWAITEGLRDDNPLAAIPKPKAGRTAPPRLTNGHVEAILATTMRRKTRTMILLACYQGFRVSEIAQIHTRDVDLIGGRLAVTGKGDVRATLPLHDVIRDEASKYSGYWFPGLSTRHVQPESVTSTIGDVMRRAGVPGTAHSLRRWYATELDAQGVSVRKIQRYLRHASIATTELYLLGDETADAEAVARLPRFGPRQRLHVA